MGSVLAESDSPLTWECCNFAVQWKQYIYFFFFTINYLKLTWYKKRQSCYCQQDNNKGRKKTSKYHLVYKVVLGNTCRSLTCIVLAAFHITVVYYNSVRASTTKFVIFLCPFVRFLVGLSAGLHKNHLMDYHEIWMDGGSQLRIDPINFFCQSRYFFAHFAKYGVPCHLC